MEGIKKERIRKYGMNLQSEVRERNNKITWKELKKKE